MPNRLALLVVALREFGGGLSSESPDQVSNPAKPQAVESFEDGLKMLDAGSLTELSKAAPGKDGGSRYLRGRLMVPLKDRGGKLYWGHRALGRALSRLGGHVGNVLCDLANAGHVIVLGTKMGTVVRLAA